MELERGMGEQIDAMAQAVVPRPAMLGEQRAAASEPGDVRLGADESVAVLRRCTALAARARVELLTETHRAASAELSVLLCSMGDWTPELLEAPDPTMVVLCAAALQDLAARLPDSGAVLAVRVEVVLVLLHAVMAQGRVAAPA